LHTSLVPAYNKARNQKKFAGMVLSSLLCIMGTIVIIIVARFDVLSAWMCRHSSPVSCQSLFRLFGVFGPIVFPSIFFLSVSSFLGSITNAHHHFMGFAFSNALVSMATVFFFYTLSFFFKQLWCFVFLVHSVGNGNTNHFYDH
jgi:peptidoglycan biosynthesis protein MviN/MurJ (putative lipid II flippase)